MTTNAITPPLASRESDHSTPELSARTHRRGLALWIAGWSLVFAPTLLVRQTGLSAWSIMAVLALRDVMVTGIMWALWRRFRGPRSTGTFAWPKTRIEQILLGLCAGLTLVYLALVATRGPLVVTGRAFNEQRAYFVPIRMLSFVTFQQVGATWLALDWNGRRMSDRQAVTLTAAVFSLLHLGLVALGLSLAWTLTLTALTAVFMWVWGTARLRWQMPWIGFVTHYGFYILIAVAFALR